MKTSILASLVSVGLMMGTTVFADDLKKNETPMLDNTSSQTIDNSKEADPKINNAEVKKEEPAKVRPFHFVGHSE